MTATEFVWDLADFKRWFAEQRPGMPLAHRFAVCRTCPIARYLTDRTGEAQSVSYATWRVTNDLPQWARRVAIWLSRAPMPSGNFGTYADLAPLVASLTDAPTANTREQG